MDKKDLIEKKFVIFIFALVTFPFFSYSQIKNQYDYILLSGKITSIQTQTNGKKTIRLNPPFELKQTKPKTIELADDGSFKDTIRSGNGLYYIFDNRNMVPIYLTKSHNFSIKYDAASYGSKSYVQIQGPDTVINRYFIDKSQNRIFVDRENTEISEETFREFLNNKKQTELQRLEKSKLPYKLNFEESKNIYYENLSELYYFLQVKSLYKPTSIPSEISRKELAINYSDQTEYKQQSYYAKLVRLYYDDKLNKLFETTRKKDSTYSEVKHSQNIIRNYNLLVHNEYIKNDLIEQDARYYLQQSNDKDAFYRDFTKYYTGKDEQLKEEIYDDYLRFTKLKTGTLSPAFYNYPNFNGGKNSLSDFKGKYIFIDIWATWCLNCWNEWPYLKKLEEEYKDRNIIFLSLSLDRLESEWRDAIKKKNLSGVQLLANGKDNFFKEYVIKGIPRYIFIDTEGKIIDYNAPRPSKTETLMALFKNAGL